jgi:hypothetical protein
MTVECTVSSVDCLVEALDQQHGPSQWNLLVESSKLSSKAFLVHICRNLIKALHNCMRHLVNRTVSHFNFKLGLIENLIKPMDDQQSRNPESHICGPLWEKADLTKRLSTVEGATWGACRTVVTNLHGNFAEDSYRSLVEELLCKFTEFKM